MTLRLLFRLFLVFPAESSFSASHAPSATDHPLISWLTAARTQLIAALEKREELTLIRGCIGGGTPSNVLARRIALERAELTVENWIAVLRLDQSLRIAENREITKTLDEMFVDEFKRAIESERCDRWRDGVSRERMFLKTAISIADSTLAYLTSRQARLAPAK